MQQQCLNQQPQCLNIYQTVRRATGYTQEQAAERIDISVESIRAYENDRCVPSERVIMRMIDVYAAPQLAIQYLRQVSELAGRFLPAVQPKDLPSAILSLHAHVTAFMRSRDDLIDICHDGVITEDERPRFNEILVDLELVQGAILGLLLTTGQPDT